jgi:very-short-patch-repair endonuclease
VNLYRANVSASTWQAAKYMRKNMRPKERELWEVVRAKQLGPRFHRQKIICGYIVDFWCPKYRLVVEVDGPTHFDGERDARRDIHLQKLGAVVIHLPVTMKVQEMREQIRAHIEAAQIKIPA